MSELILPLYLTLKNGCIRIKILIYASQKEKTKIDMKNREIFFEKITVA